MQNSTPARLLLADGTLFEGAALGAQGSHMGELVFTTAMGGTQGLLTDPCLHGKLLLLAFPIAVAYGINDDDSESASCHPRALIVREVSDEPSNFRASDALGDYLKRNGIIGLTGIDTRAVARHLREHGSMAALITTEPTIDMAAALAELAAYTEPPYTAQLSVKGVTPLPAGGERVRLGVYDYGHSRSLISWLHGQGASVTLLPHDLPAAEALAAGFDGIILSDGPGSPAAMPVITDIVKALIAAGIPLLGIGYGHLALGLAAGGEIKNIGNGHRGGNVAVREAAGPGALATAQNSGYVLSTDKIPHSTGVATYLNIADGTCAGMRYLGFTALSYAFSPTAGLRTAEQARLFESFLELINKGVGVCR